MEKTNGNTTGNKEVETKDIKAQKDVKESKDVKEPKAEKPKREKKARKPRGSKRGANNDSESSSIEGLLAVDISKPQNLIDAGYSIAKLQLLYIKTAIDYLKEVK